MSEVGTMSLGTVPERTKSVDDDINLGSLLSIQKAAEMARTNNNGGDEDEAEERDTLQDLNITRRAPSRSSSASVRPQLSRGVQRSQSVRLPRSSPGMEPLARTPSRGNIGRSSSMKVPHGPGELSQTPSRRGLTRSNSTSLPRTGSVRGTKRFDSFQGESGLRPVNERNQAIGRGVERKESFRQVGRNISGISMDSCESGLESCFSRDSVSIRKHQLVADPLDDGTYHEDASFADHDTKYSMSVMSDDESFGDITEYLPPGYSPQNDLLLMAHESFGQSFRGLSNVQVGGSNQSVCSGISGDHDMDFLFDKEESSHVSEEDSTEEADQEDDLPSDDSDSDDE